MSTLSLLSSSNVNRYCATASYEAQWTLLHWLTFSLEWAGFPPSLQVTCIVGSADAVNSILSGLILAPSQLLLISSFLEQTGSWPVLSLFSLGVLAMGWVFAVGCCCFGFSLHSASSTLSHQSQQPRVLWLLPWSSGLQMPWLRREAWPMHSARGRRGRRLGDISASFFLGFSLLFQHICSFSCQRSGSLSDTQPSWHRRDTWAVSFTCPPVIQLVADADVFFRLSVF